MFYFQIFIPEFKKFQLILNQIFFNLLGNQKL